MHFKRALKGFLHSGLIKRAGTNPPNLTEPETLQKQDGNGLEGLRKGQNRDSLNH
jgi:hypothetical protein